MLAPSPSRRTARRPTRFALAGLLALALPAHGADGDYLGRGITAFDLGGGLTDAGAAVVVQPDGRVIVAGTAATGSGSWAPVLARFLPNGALDGTFGAGGKVVSPFGVIGFNDSVAALHLLRDGRLLVAGTADWGLGDTDFWVGRLLSNGAADSTFGSLPNGVGATLVSFDLGDDDTDNLGAMTVDRNNRILLVGSVDVSATDIDFGVARLTAEGVLDSGFSGDGLATVDPSFGAADHALAVAYGNQGILVAGAAWASWSGGHFDVAVARLLGDGSLDPGFGSGGTSVLGQAAGGSNNDYAWGVGVWPDGEVVVGGEVATGTDASMWFVARFDSGGSYLAGVSGAFCGFEPPCPSSPRDTARALLLEADGKILLGGFGLAEQSNVDFGLARLTRDLTPDASFGGGDGVRTYGFDRGPGAQRDLGTALSFDHDGRIVLAGSAEWSGLDTDFAWARFDSSYLFADDFDWPGGTSRWSATVP